MFTPLFWLMILSFVLEWTVNALQSIWPARTHRWCWLHWVTKPGSLLLLIAWFTQVGHWQGGLVWFGAGLVFSLLGDVLLLLPDRFFLSGLAAFFSAHILYIIGFNQPVVFGLTTLLGGTLFLMPIYARAILRDLRAAHMLTPVAAYSTVILIMGLNAVLTLLRPTWRIDAAVLVSLGALSFILSDSSLALDRFAHPSPTLKTLVMITYQLGQLLITAGALLNFSALPAV